MRARRGPHKLESFWSLLKRVVLGTYHNVSKAYLPLYLNEFSFRFNNRKNPDNVGRDAYDVEKTRQEDERLREELRNADVKKFDKAMDNLMKPNPLPASR
jgi:hypothetical protein